MLHGVGANGNDLISLADRFAGALPDTAFHAPDAPSPYADAPAGRQWYARIPWDERADGVRKVEPVVNAFIDELLDGYGGMLSFELEGDVERAERFLGRLTIPIVAPSLGGTESLIIRPAAAVHVGLTPEEREASGISDALIRFSVGLEAADDLIADLARAIAA